MQTNNLPCYRMEKLNFEDEIPLRRVDCNNPTLFNKKKLNKDDYWRHFYLSGNREL
jgi:hypothetical protein